MGEQGEGAEFITRRHTVGWAGSRPRAPEPQPLVPCHVAISPAPCPRGTSQSLPNLKFRFCNDTSLQTWHDGASETQGSLCCPRRSPGWVRWVGETLDRESEDWVSLQSHPLDLRLEGCDSGHSAWVSWVSPGKSAVGTCTHERLKDSELL